MKILDNKRYIKLVFFGPALAGKTSILEWIYNEVIPNDMKMSPGIRQIKTSFGQTLLFDFAPIRVSDNMIARIYTSTGQNYYKGNRSLTLSNADGVFLVLDSDEGALSRNHEIVDELNYNMNHLPSNTRPEVIVLFNKQDSAKARSLKFLGKELKLNNSWDCFPTSAVTGRNLKRSFLEMLKKNTSKKPEYIDSSNKMVAAGGVR